jgi:hypothetical protein
LESGLIYGIAARDMHQQERGGEEDEPYLAVAL